MSKERWTAAAGIVLVAAVVIVAVMAGLLVGH